MPLSAQDVHCPICQMPPDHACIYVEGAAHNGWHHVARVEQAEMEGAAMEHNVRDYRSLGSTTED